MAGKGFAFRFAPLRPESEEFLHLDALRIVAALAIVTFHWGGSHAGWLTNAAHLDLQPLASFVDLFFVISGVVICRVYNGMANFGAFVSFMRKRFARLAPLHYAMLAVYVAIGLAAPLAGMALNEPDKYDMSCVVPNLLFLQATPACPKLTFNFPSWSIGAEMMCYMIFPLLLALYRVRVWAPAALAVAMMGTLYAIGPAGPLHRLWVEWTFEWSVLRALPAFALGVSLYGLRRPLARVPMPGVLIYAALALFALMMVARVWLGLFLPVAYVIAALALAADERGKTGAVVRTLAPWGQLTYGVYMLHAVFMTVLFSIGFDRLLHMTPAVKAFAVVASVPLLLAAAYLSLNLFERPARRWLQGSGRPRAVEMGLEPR